MEYPHCKHKGPSTPSHIAIYTWAKYFTLPHRQTTDSPKYSGGLKTSSPYLSRWSTHQKFRTHFAKKNIRTHRKGPTAFEPGGRPFNYTWVPRKTQSRDHASAHYNNRACQSGTSLARCLLAPPPIPVAPTAPRLVVLHPSLRLPLYGRRPNPRPIAPPPPPPATKPKT
jgi:hypothetical protein